MTTYTTKQGDTWDMIAKSQYGDTAYTGQLLMANLKYCDYFFFPAGITLSIPELDTTQSSATVPWKAVEG